MQCCNALHYGVDTACVLFLICVCAPLVIGDLEPAKNGLIPHEPHYFLTSCEKGDQKGVLLFGHFFDIMRKGDQKGGFAF